MAYRVEVAVSGRAICSAVQCKQEAVKIPKGELRQGTQFVVKEMTMMRWRHWGCVTPQVLHNWAETSEGDMDMVDGYDTLPADLQEKVKRALENEHVDDDDWNGDIECNRFDPSKKNMGMYVKSPKKKKKADDDDDEEASPAMKKAMKKRGRGQDDDEVEMENTKPAKKAKGRGKKAAAEVEENDDEPAPPQKKSRAKKAKSTDTVVSSDAAAPEDEPAPPPVKKGRAKKAPAVAALAEDAATEPAPKKRRGRPRKATAGDEE